MSRVVYLALNAADHLVSKGRLDAAASILRNYLSTNEPEPMVMQRLGRIYLSQGRSAEAVPMLQEALEYFQKQAIENSSSQSANATANELASSAFDPSATQTSLDDQFIAMH